MKVEARQENTGWGRKEKQGIIVGIQNEGLLGSEVKSQVCVCVCIIYNM